MVFIAYSVNRQKKRADNGSLKKQLEMGNFLEFSTTNVAGHRLFGH